MSELINNDPLPEEELSIDSEGHSPWTMFITMLLLIAGFSLSSILLMHQTLQSRSSNGEPVFSLSALAEKGKAMVKPKPKDVTTDPAPQAAQAKTQDATPSALENIRQIVMDRASGENIRWPKLRLTGFGKSAAGTESFAYINGDLVHPGEYAGKVKLIEVRNHDVVVEYKGERRNLTVELAR